MSILYHYCPTDKCFSILSGKNLRMSDISKSNDYMELQLIFPELHYKIWELYNENSFPFCYEGEHDEDAMRKLLRQSKQYWDSRLDSGDFSDYVVCFSEAKDSLSQWRGYADNGKGCCIGFSKSAICSLCNGLNGVLRLEKVQYITETDLIQIIEDYARQIVENLQGLRQWIVENMTHNDEDDDTDGLTGFNFDTMVASCLTDSLKYKEISFKEEQEWRLFLTDNAYKEPDWICCDHPEDLKGPTLFSETISFLKSRTDFCWTDDDLISFCKLSFDEFEENPVKELWFGPKSRIWKKDAELFLKKNGYENVSLFESAITYR